MSSFDDLSKSPPSPPRSPRSQTPASETPASPTLPQDPVTPSGIIGLDPRDRDPEKVRQEAWDEDSHAFDRATDKESLSDRLQGTHSTDTSPSTSATPAGEQRPMVSRHDTDSFEDYPDTAPQDPIGETPGEDLKVSPYGLEHPDATTATASKVTVLSSPTLFPAPGVGGSEASVASGVSYPKYGVGSSPAVAGTSESSHLGTPAALGLEGMDRSAKVESDNEAELEAATPSTLLWPENSAAAAGPLPTHGESEGVPGSPLHTPDGTRYAEPLPEHESGYEKAHHGSNENEGKEKEPHKASIVEKIKDALGGHKEEGKKEQKHEKE